MQAAERASSIPTSSSQTFICPKCGRVCASRISIYSHQQACKNWPSTFPTILVCKEWAIISVGLSLCVNGMCLRTKFCHMQTFLCHLGAMHYYYDKMRTDNKILFPVFIPQDHKAHPVGHGSYPCSWFSCITMCTIPCLSGSCISSAILPEHC